MKTKSFVTLLIGIIVVGGIIGGTLAGGMAIGKKQGRDQANQQLQSQISQLASRLGQRGSGQGTTPSGRTPSGNQNGTPQQGTPGGSGTPQPSTTPAGSQSGTPQPGTTPSGGQGGTPQPGTTPQGGPGVGGRGNTGTVSKIEGNIITLTTSTGILSVKTSDITIVEKMIKGSLADISAGENIMVTGQRNADGSIAAANITIIPVLTSGGQPGAFPGGQGASGGPPAGGAGGGFGGRRTIGTVDKIEGNVITLNTPAGAISVQVSDSTTIDKTVKGSLTDIAAGETITASGQRDADGSVEATIISIVSGS